MAGEVRLRRHGALDDLAEALAAASSDALRIEVEPACSVLNLRGTPADPSLVTDVQRVLGIELPLEPNRWRGDDRLTAMWLGPDEWLLVASDDEARQIEERMRQARLADPWLSIVNVSSNYTHLLLSGPEIRDLLAKCCALDLRPDVFSRGDCVQTELARSRMLLRAIERNSFEVWVRNSFARYLAEWLLDACAERRSAGKAPAR